MTGARGKGDTQKESKPGGSDFEPVLIEPGDCCRRSTGVVAKLGAKTIGRQLAVDT